jgi:hypothetical protein
MATREKEHVTNNSRDDPTRVPAASSSEFCFAAGGGPSTAIAETPRREKKGNSPYHYDERCT